MCPFSQRSPGELFLPRNYADGWYGPTGDCGCCGGGCEYCPPGEVPESWDVTISGLANNGSCTNGRTVGCTALNATFTLDEAWDGVPTGALLFDTNPPSNCAFMYDGADLDLICLDNDYAVRKLVVLWDNGSGLAQYFCMFAQHLTNSSWASVFSGSLVSACDETWTNFMSGSSFGKCNVSLMEVTVEPTP